MDRRRQAFTLVELLIVIGIIALLIGILVPVVSRVRKAARVTDTQNTITQLATAIQNYYNEFKSYPGPFGNDEIIAKGPKDTATGNPITDSENLYLGLNGGLTLGANGSIVLTPAKFGHGPVNLNPRDPKTYDPFATNFPTSPAGAAFKDEGGNVAGDSGIPEFLDRFPDPLPIIYARGRSGAPGIATAGGNATRYQYHVNQLLPYTGSNIGGVANKGGHGLTQPGSFAPAGEGKNDLIPYLRHPQMPGASNDSGTARKGNEFILVSPGPDRIYGTPDDITNFGAVIVE